MRSRIFGFLPNKGLTRIGCLMAGLCLWQIATPAASQQNPSPPQLKTTQEDTSEDPYQKSETSEETSRSNQNRGPLDKEPTVEEWRDEAQKLLDRLSKILKAIPSYDMPTVDENGDIIIRRHPQDADPYPDQDPKSPKKPSNDGKTLGT